MQAAVEVADFYDDLSIFPAKMWKSFLDSWNHLIDNGLDRLVELLLSPSPVTIMINESLVANLQLYKKHCR